MRKLLVCAMMTAGSLYAATMNWGVFEGEYGLGSNWTEGSVPETDDYGFIANGGIATLSDGTYSCQRVDIGNGGNNGTLRQTGGSLTFSNYPSIGYAGATGTYLLSGGTLTVNSILRIGRHGQGIFRITGGTVTVSNNTEMGRYVEANDNELTITDGIYNQTGGSLVVGWEGSATATVSGNGTIVVEPAASITIANAAATGTLRLSTGGTIVAPAISLPNAGGTFVLDGGTLRVNKNSPSDTPFINGTGTVTISNNGAFIDTQEFSAMVKSDISSQESGGSLTKSGSGTLTLAGNNTYGGTTTVSEGTLAVRTPDSLPGYDQPGRVIIAAGAFISPGVGWTAAQIDTLRANVTYLGSGEVPILSNCEYDTSAGDLTVAEDLNLSVPLVKSGANMLALTGHNTFVEPALVREGTLQADFGQGLDADFPV
ncbi:MAG: autotransporter-associated beta strand repeat-containing protein, partial [Kiritimatiellae bacterium]|nr:autotransporter-associated beta strand repeat-containing protein [Kiritimatiellia bacterium]